MRTLVLGALMVCACAPNEPRAAKGPAIDPETSIQLYCGACHPAPAADVLPRSAWNNVIRKMYLKLHPKSGLSNDGRPRMLEAIRYYEQAAPEAFPLTAQPTPAIAGGFRAANIPLPPGRDMPAGVSSVIVAGDRILMTDMLDGSISALSLAPGSAPVVLATAKAPASVEVVDLDADGTDDLVVAELGTPFPAETDLGAVLWLRGRPDGSYETTALLEGVGRVANVKSADLDGDGDLDLVVAIVGYPYAGRLVWLENRDMVFTEHLIDPRDGATHVDIVDLNRDGRLDVVALHSQHYETVVGYLRGADGAFTAETLYRAPHPDWGLASMHTADVDGDGDLDVLVSAGDAMDTSVLKDSHGVYLLQNDGAFPFAATRIAAFAGAYKTQAADLDDDGDLDIVASSFIHIQPHLLPPEQRTTFASVLWLERLPDGSYVRHVLETGLCSHATLAIADLDGDGDLDIVAGQLFPPGPAVPPDAGLLTVFTSLRK